MRDKVNLSNLKEIYLISNTASFLYSSFVADESIQYLVSEYSTSELTQVFASVSQMEIDNIDDLVWAYALYVAILLKSDDRTFDFLKKEGAISFEWFIELKNIFLARFKPENHFSFSQETRQISPERLKQYSESETQVFEL